jgi:hypothetical protein
MGLAKELGERIRANQFALASYASGLNTASAATVTKCLGTQKCSSTDTHENRSFAKTKEWQELKDAHQKVHNLVQNTADLYANKSSNNEIFSVTNQLENNINIVFDKLDKIRELNCN